GLWRARSESLKDPRPRAGGLLSVRVSVAVAATRAARRAVTAAPAHRASYAAARGTTLRTAPTSGGGACLGWPAPVADPTRSAVHRWTSGRSARCRAPALRTRAPEAAPRAGRRPWQRAPRASPLPRTRSPAAARPGPLRPAYQQSDAP